jgi:hypothetical protein
MFDSEKDDNELLFGVVSVVNQKLSEQISVASRRGIEQSAKKGNYTGSFAPYGYKKTVIHGRKTLQVDDEAAEVVKLIYNLYINHQMGEKSIVNYLNSPEKAILSPKCKAWGITTIQRILQNEAYTGRNVFSKYTRVIEYNDLDNMSNRSKKLVQRSKDCWIRSENKTHEQIIDDSTYHKAQEIRLTRGKGIPGGHKRPVNVFSKLIYCKLCGSALVTMSIKARIGKRYYYLICSKRRRQGATSCDNNKWIPYHEFRDELIGWIEEQIGERIDIETGTNYLITQLTQHEHSEKKMENKINKIKNQIEKNREMIFKLRRQNMNHLINDEQFNFEKMTYEKEITELEVKLTLLQTEISITDNLSEDKVKIISEIEKLTKFSSMDEVEKVRFILSKLISKIFVDQEGNVDVYTLLG